MKTITRHRTLRWCIAPAWLNLILACIFNTSALLLFQVLTTRMSAVICLRVVRHQGAAWVFAGAENGAVYVWCADGHASLSEVCASAVCASEGLFVLS